MSPIRMARCMTAASALVLLLAAPSGLASGGSLSLSGSAEGGCLKLTVDAARVSLRTRAGASAGDVLSSLAALLRATPGLEGLEVVVADGRLDVDAVVSSVVITDPGLAPGSCGNARVEFGEACDDGNARPGDGCSATCEDEFDWQLYGVSAGDGGVSLVVRGIEVGLKPSRGLSSRAVLTELGVALAMDPDLAALGLHAVVVGDRLVLNEPIGFVSGSDSGLQHAGKLASQSR